VVECPTQAARAEQLMAGVTVACFPVREAGSVLWVWLGSTPAPAFPELPFFDESEVDTRLTFTIVPCNWLQGLEGSLDSAHTTFLHQTWLNEVEKRYPSNTPLALAKVPRYESDETSFGLRAAAVRPTADGRTYLRVTHWYFPLVTVAPTGFFQRRTGTIFAYGPIDDTHHMLFFGTYGDEPQRTQKDLGAVRGDLELDPRNFGALQGDHSNRWGQDRALMKAGHFTGFGRSLLEEDAAVQVSMGPIVDRTRENLSSSDVAIAHARRMILDAIAGAALGELPPGSARAGEPIRVPDAFDMLLDEGVPWREAPSSGERSSAW
jgi:hypothetical protein